jgi:carbamoyltransferase
MNKESIVWGVNNLSHQASLSVAVGNDVKFSSLAERFSKIKNDRKLNSDLLDYASQFGLPDKVVFCGVPWKKTLESILYAQFHLHRKKDQIRELSLSKRVKHQFVDHHSCHAANSWFTSPFSHGCVLVVDGFGDLATVSVWSGEGSSLKCLWRLSYPHSLGLFYSYYAKELGFKPNEEEFYLMGLSQHGEPKYYDNLLSRHFLEDEILISKINCHLHTPLDFEYSQNDLAASVQKVYETLFERLLKKTYEMTQAKNICLSGGSVMNSIANKLAFKFFDQVYIPPAPGDGGNSLGALLWEQKEKVSIGNGYLGYDLGQNLNHDKVVELLKAEGLVAIAQGQAELGPRALGHRSILANILDDKAIEKLIDIKNRAFFRPFSPVVLQEDYAHYFTGPMETSSMMHHTIEVKEEHKGLFKNVSGPQGFSRVQTVSEHENRNLFKILQKWKKTSGHGLLLNTSLNVRGRPIINDKYDLKLFSEKTSLPIVCADEA